MSEVDEQVKESLRYLEAVATVRNSAANGRFGGVPDDLAKRNYHFVHVGHKGDVRAQRKAQYLCERGYRVAPSSVYAMGFEGVDSLIVGAPEEVYHNLKAARQVATRQMRERMRHNDMSEIERTLRESLPKGTDISVSSVLGSGTYADMGKDLASASAQVASAGNQRKR